MHRDKSMPGSGARAGKKRGTRPPIAQAQARRRSKADITRIGSIIDGKYKIHSVIADVRFSRTVCAEQTGSGSGDVDDKGKGGKSSLQLQAIKVLQRDCQYVCVQEARLRFLNEHDLSNLHYIVRFVDTIHHAGRFSLVLELLAPSLFSLLQRTIHADVNPENVLLSLKTQHPTQPAQASCRHRHSTGQSSSPSTLALAVTSTSCSRCTTSRPRCCWDCTATSAWRCWRRWTCGAWAAC